MYELTNAFVLDGNNSKNKQKLLMVTGFLKQTFITNPEEYFIFLRSFQSDINVICDVSLISIKGSITSNEAHAVISFRIYICELVYNAVNSFPHICEYTISCKNDINNAQLIFGYFSDLDDQNEPGMCKLINSYDTYILNKFDIYTLFVGNRIANPDYDVINALVVALHMGGSDPVVKIEYKINPKIIKTALK